MAESLQFADTLLLALIYFETICSNFAHSNFGSFATKVVIFCVV